MAKLLIIEPDPEVHQVLRDALCGVGHSVQVVATGCDGLRAIHETAPNLIVVEAELPDMTGVQVCAAIRREPFAGGVRVMLLTDPFADRAFGPAPDSVDDVLVKPFSIPALLDRVQRLTSVEGQRV